MLNEIVGNHQELAQHPCSQHLTKVEENWEFSMFAQSTQDLSQRQDPGHMEILLSICRCSIWHNPDGTHTHTRHKGEQLLCPLVFAMDHNNCKICAGVPLAFDELGHESDVLTYEPILGISFV